MVEENVHGLCKFLTQALRSCAVRRILDATHWRSSLSSRCQKCLSNLSFPIWGLRSLVQLSEESIPRSLIALSTDKFCLFGLPDAVCGEVGFDLTTAKEEM